MARKKKEQALPKDAEADILRIAGVLRGTQRICKQDLRNTLGGWTAQQTELIIWRARELLRKNEQIVFVPLRDYPDHITRATPKQTGKRGKRFIAAAHRKSARAVEHLQLAASQTSDEKEKERLERAAEREVERENFRRKRAV